MKYAVKDNKKTLSSCLCSNTYKINGWSQVGLVVFFKTDVLNLCGGSSNCIRHRGFTLPANTAEIKFSLYQCE